MPPIPLLSFENFRAFLEQQTKEHPPSTPVLRTQNANLGAYLIAVNALRWKGAVIATNGRDVEFHFYDPDARGPDLIRRFNGGAVELVNARLLLDIRGYLLGEVKHALAAELDRESA